MRRRLFLFSVAAVFLLLAGVFLFAVSGAKAEPNVQFPVAELGGCASQEACRSYCDKPANMESCLSFAEQHGLMSGEELSQARKFMAAGGKGPGGCTSKDSCEAFCNDTTHIKECVAFAEKSGMMSGKELDEARKVAKALESGAVLPGGCTSKQACDAYCGGDNADHMKECIAFAKAAGFMSEEEAKEVDKVLSALEKGVKPPKCRGDEECAVYCADHVEECISFSLAAGMMTEEQALMMRKTGGKGPGGCLGRACETFCNDPANAEACFNFAKETGQLKTDETFEHMVEGRDRFKNEFRTMPASVQECLQNSLGGDLDTMLAGNPPSSEAAAKMRVCFESMRPPASQDSGSPRGSFQGGPPAGAGSEPPSGFDRSVPPEGFQGHDGSGSGGYPPPDGFTRPPEEFTPPPEAYRVPPSGYEGQPPPNGSYAPPASGDIQYQTAPAPTYEVPPEPPAADSTEPTGFSPREGTAALLWVFLGVFK